MARRLLDAPMAVTSTGAIVAGITHLTSERIEPGDALEHALRSGRRIFIAVELTKGEVSASKGRLDDALAEILTTIVYRERG